MYETGAGRHESGYRSGNRRHEADVRRYRAGRPFDCGTSDDPACCLGRASVPMLVLVQNGVGAKILTPIISILIILGAISTAVNMISGIVTRCVNSIERNKSEAERTNGHLLRNAIFTAIFTFLAFAIAQFGLMAVVKKGYAYLGYAAFITLFVPFVVHAIATKGKEI